MLFTLFILRRVFPDSKWLMLLLYFVVVHGCIYFGTELHALRLQNYSAIKYTHRIRFVQSHLVFLLSLSLFFLQFIFSSVLFFRLLLADSLKYVVNHLLNREKMHLSIKNSPLENVQFGELIMMQKKKQYKVQLQSIYASY